MTGIVDVLSPFCFCFVVIHRILYDKRFSAFHYPVSDEDAPNYRSIIQNPMDMATLLQRVDSGQYITCSTFLQDFDLIVANAKVLMIKVPALLRCFAFKIIRLNGLYYMKSSLQHLNDLMHASPFCLI